MPETSDDRSDEEKARDRERYRAQYRANRERIAEYRRKYRPKYIKRLKQQVYTAYGNCCNCCGEDNPGFLSVDHVNGGGRQHRAEVGGALMVLLDIIRNDFPADYQLLCFNCNLGRNLNGGICPHKSSQEAAS